MKSKRKKSSNLTFKVAVKKTPDIARGYQSGLKGLGAHSTKVQISKNSLCDGSVDIDSNVASKYPNDNRWDYALSYKAEVFFVEVHSAHTGEVKTVIKKLQWLKVWLVNSAPLLNTLRAKSKGPFFGFSQTDFTFLEHRHNLDKQLKRELSQYLY